MAKFFREIAMALSVVVPLALGIYALQNYVETSRRKSAIDDNLDRIVLAAKVYLAENEYRQVAYSELIAGKYLEEIKPVDGENYKNLVLRRMGGVLLVKTASGKIVERKY